MQLTSDSLPTAQSERRFAEIRRDLAASRKQVRQTILRIREKQLAFVRMARIERTRRVFTPRFRDRPAEQT